jgi:hypothetical protein
LGAVGGLHHTRLKQTGLVEYRFRPDAFEVRHVKAAGQADVDLERLLGKQ